MLFMQQGDKVRARQDLERPQPAGCKTCGCFEGVVEGAVEGQGSGGVAAQYD
ncbi:MAG: hypothetical protein IPQ21_22395 [Betaproteobacteria bacterium]|nr:hypothetical protein [Betaproteobacteria bacterium]